MVISGDGYSPEGKKQLLKDMADLDQNSKMYITLKHLEILTEQQGLISKTTKIMSKRLKK